MTKAVTLPVHRGEAKVGDVNLREPARTEDVFWFNIAMVYAPCMAMDDGIDELRHCTLDESAVTLEDALLDRGEEVATSGEIEDEEGVLALSESTVDGNDIWMVSHPSMKVTFLHMPGVSLGSTGSTKHTFYGILPRTGEIYRTVYDGESAGAQNLGETKAARVDSCTNEGGGVLDTVSHYVVRGLLPC